MHECMAECMGKCINLHINFVNGERSGNQIRNVKNGFVNIDCATCT